MAVDKLVDNVALDTAMTATANAIRAKTGSQASITWDADDGFADIIDAIQTGGNNQTKTGIVPTESSQTIIPDQGYDGLNSVQINGISSTYVGSGVTRKAAQTYTPTTTNQTIAAGQYLDGAQIISGDANLTAGNIKKGATIFGITGTYSPITYETIQKTVTVTCKAMTDADIRGKPTVFNFSSTNTSTTDTVSISDIESLNQLVYVGCSGTATTLPKSAGNGVTTFVKPCVTVVSRTITSSGVVTVKFYPRLRFASTTWLEDRATKPQASVTLTFRYYKKQS